MPLSLRRGRVSAIGERQVGLVRLEVDGRPCIAYPRLTGPVALGDDVLVNTQALDLGLGSGGFDILYANLTRGLGLGAEAGAHVMELPYTPLQHAAVRGEEQAQTERLGGLPVVACTLHSQLVPACAALRGRRVAYVQVEGGALPVSLSDAVRALRRAGLLSTAIAAGACLDGDVSCVSAAAALLFAAASGHDAVVCAVGPGIVGTATRFGHGAVGVVQALVAAAALGGVPILAPRLSTAEGRERHRGLSHHTEAVLELAPRSLLAWPEGFPGMQPVRGAQVVDVTGWPEACAGLPLSSMGRGANEEPWLFASGFAAGRAAALLAASGAPPPASGPSANASR
jgi:hypothetical protein